jgi:uncharacterized damage-inducible protein DinB
MLDRRNDPSPWGADRALSKGTLMKAPIRAASLAMAALVSVAPLAIAHDDVTPASSGAFKAEMLQWFTDAEDKLLQLAEATPESKYGYRPGKDKAVRTAGQVFMHVAAANFGIPGFTGVQPPEGFDFRTFEGSLTKKTDVQKALKDSFAHMKQAFSSLSDADLEKPAEFFGMKTTTRGAYLLLLSHSHEHLGQSIAYARGNGIVPPWTVKQQAAAKEKEKTAENK